MTVDDKPYLFNREKLAQPIHMKLSQKQKIFLYIFFAFSKPVLNFKYFPKKVSLIPDVFPDMLAPKNMVE